MERSQFGVPQPMARPDCSKPIGEVETGWFVASGCEPDIFLKKIVDWLFRSVLIVPVRTVEQILSL